VNLKLELLK